MQFFFHKISFRQFEVNSESSILQVKSITKQTKHPIENQYKSTEKTKGATTVNVAEGANQSNKGNEVGVGLLNI